MRETKEETGIEITNLRKVAFTNDYFEGSQKHYVTLFMQADYLSGDVKVMEPDKCLEWKWVSWEDLPRPLFLPIENLLKEKFRPSA